jgi:hypothetical protein
MTTLRREDGLQFIIQPYRELFAANEKGAALKRKIRLLAAQRGLNVRIYGHDSQLEAIFSPDSGFLLGESVWFYLNKPANLIFCEALPERRLALIVVVRNGVIFMDAKVSFTELMDEFASLSTTNDKYDIYTSGEVPLGESGEGGKFVFDKSMVNSFNVLDEPIFNKIPVYENAQLQPLELALTSPYLGKSKVLPIIVGIVVIISLIIGWHIMKNISAQNAPLLRERLVVEGPPPDPYAGYYQTLAVPAPQKQLDEFVHLIEIMDGIPGWSLKQITYDGSQYSIQINVNGGTITELQNWADEHNINIKLKSDGVFVTLPSSLTNRPKTKEIYPIKNILPLLMDEMDLLLKGKSISLGEITDSGKYKVASLTVNFDKVYPTILSLVGEELNKFPVSISNISANVDGGLCSGTITLKVLGD